MNHKLTGIFGGLGALGLALILLASPASAAWGGNLVPGGGMYFDKLQFDAEPGGTIVQNIYIYANITTDTWVETSGAGMVLIYAFEDETSYPVAWEYTLKATNDTQMKLTLTVPSNAKQIDYGVFVWDAGAEGCDGGYDGFLEVVAAGGVAKYFTVSVVAPAYDMLTPILFMMGGMVMVGIAGVWLAATRNKYKHTYWDEAAAAILMIVAIGAIVWGAWNALRLLGYL